MTSYSIPSEITPKNLDTFTGRNSQSEDWESKMARLVGLQEESPTTVDVATEESAESASLESPVSQPQEIATEQSLSSNPFAKLALVGSATLAIVLLAGVFLSQMMSSTSNQKSVSSPLVASTAPTPSTNLSRQQVLELEVENLKTKLALAEQAQALTVAQQNLRTATNSRSVTQPTPQVDTSAADRNRLRMAQQTVPTPVRTVYVPRIVTVERRVETPPSQTQNAIAAVPPAPQVPVVTPEVKPTPPDPLQEWARLAKLGSYGEVSASSQSNSQPQNTANVPSQTINPDPNQAPQPPQPPQQQNPVVSQAQSQNSKSVRVGTSAKAVLATAVFGETTRSRNNEQNEESKNVFVVQLKEPLKAVDGSIALPANTELLTQVGAISEQGFLQLDVVKVVSQNNGNLSESNLPSNAIIIRGVKGRPLMASKFPNSSRSIAGMDAGLFVLGGIGKAAELFNRSDTEYVCPTNNSNGICTLNNNTRRNIPAGILEGGLNSLVPQISQRNQQAIAQMMQQTNVWFVPAGKEVEIYVNQSIQF